MLPKITDYWDTAQEAIPRFAAELSGLAPEAARELTALIRAEVTEHFRVLTDKQVLLATVAIADDLYRAASAIPCWDDSVSDYLECSASSFFSLLKKRGYRLEYVIDNGFDDLQRPTQLFPEWFRACGIVYICPQDAACRLMRADGVAVDAYPAALARTMAEARDVGSQLARRCRQEARHFVYLETDCIEGSHVTALQDRGAPGTLSVFRREAPVPGSKVEVVFPKQKLG